MIFLVVSVVAMGVVLGQPTPEPTTEVESAIQAFQADLNSLFCDGLSVGGNHCESTYGIQNFIDSFHDDFEDETEDVSDVVQGIMDRVDTELTTRAGFLTTLTEAVNTSCREYRYGVNSEEDTLTDFDDLYFAGNEDRSANLPWDMAYNPLYGQSVSLTNSTYRLPNNVHYNEYHILQDAALSQLLESTMVDLHDEHCVDDDGSTSYCSMYFGTVNGLFRIFPGTESSTDDNGQYNSYDPRFRPWYVTAASGSEDVVIMMDISGSMAQNGRLSLAKQAVIAVLSTLGRSSMVAVIAYNHDVELSCFGEQLVAVTPRNIAKLIEFVEELSADGDTDFEVAFDAAFDILETESSRNCKSSILFLTHGAGTNVTSLVQTRNTEDIGATVFSYTLGDEADPTVAQSVANVTGGIYTHIDDGDEDLLTAMSSFYLYYAYGNGADDNDIVVTSPYLDFSTGVAMITMAKSVYFEGYFIGVVGTDIPLTLLSDTVGEVVLGRKSYSFLVNEQEEVILHPLLANPLITSSFEGDYGFIVGDEEMTWNEAEQWCLDNHGRHLASIHSDCQNSAAAAVCDECWLGATCQDGEWDDFEWSDGSSFSYTSWADGEPNNWDDEEECVLNWGEEWYDSTCDEEFRPLCGFSWSNGECWDSSDEDSWDDPANQDFQTGWNEYNTIYLGDLEPAEFDAAEMLAAASGHQKIEGVVKTPAGDVTFNGYTFTTENLLYFYSKVGPKSLTLNIAIYTNEDTEYPNIPGFGLAGSPNTVCAVEEQEPSDCIAPFVLYHDLQLADACEVDWFDEAGIVYNTAIGDLNSEEYAAWYLRAGGWNSPNAALNTQPTCDQLDALHTFTNRLGSSFGSDMPFGGFRDELWLKLFNQIKVLPSMGQFWKSNQTATHSPFETTGSLESGSVFDIMYFASYQGLFIIYPARKMAGTYNPLIRPWYQAAASLPDSTVITTPYKDFSTGELVASGAVAITAPNSTDIFGVAAFDYDFSAFVQYWDETLNSVCQSNDGHFCYLMDSHGFLLYYNGIAGDVNDDDISHKFVGDFEPTLMQSLLDIGLFNNQTNANYLDDTLDLSYTVDDEVYATLALSETAREFEYNAGEYTVHKIVGTNLYLVRIDDWSQTYPYPSDCPNDAACSSVRSPGCIMDAAESCVSIKDDICASPDTPTLSDNNCVAESLDDDILSMLEEGVHLDFCVADIEANNYTDYGFIVGDYEMTWNEAEQWCLDNHGRHLASIHSDCQNSAAAAVCDECWLGATCQDGEWDDFEWSDGSSFSYTSWADGEPNNWDDEEECVHNWGEDWNDATCDEEFRPLCGFGWSGGECWNSTGEPSSGDHDCEPYSEDRDCAIQDFQSRLNSLFCDGLSVGGDRCDEYGIQDFIDSFDTYFETGTEDVTDVVHGIMERVDEELNMRAGFLTTLTEAVSALCSAFSDVDALADFDDLYFAGNEDRSANLPSDMAYNPVYGQSVSLTHSTYELPNNVDHTDERIMRDAALSYLLESTMVDLHDEHCVDDDGSTSYCSMFFGTVNGLFRGFPGTEASTDDNGKYNSYDPRFRPWYVTAASGSKDVVILLDISGSMMQNGRMALAKEAVKSALNTLGQSSMVAVVAFNDDIELTCFGKEFVSATPRNVAKLEQWVDNLHADGSTNFEVAFDAAFDIFETRAQSCQSSILFLTDGVADDVTDLVRTRNTEDISATVFSYTLGDGANRTIPLKVANATGGIYTHIDDGGNLLTAMSSYYLYYAFGGSAEGSEPVMTSPYLDFSTRMAMITMALPVYFEQHFVGVVGIDLPLNVLSEAIGEVTLGRKSYVFVVNGEEEVILHPLVADPLTTLFSVGDEYNPVYISNLEPDEFNVANMMDALEGTQKIEGTFMSPAGDVTVNGYVASTENVLYFYKKIGPTSLTLNIVIYTDAETSAPDIPSFGFINTPNSECLAGYPEPSNCIAPFVLYHDLTLADECEVDWYWDAEIEYRAASHSFGTNIYATWYLQAGGWDSPNAAINGQPSCDELNALHTFTNRLGSVFGSDMPFGGFRDELWAKLFHQIKVLPSMGEFWKSSYLAEDSHSVFYQLYFASYQGLHITYPGKAMSSVYNPLIRPWYRLAATYPDVFVVTTPYKDFSTGELVATGATAIIAPGTSHTFGVAAFDYEFSEFLGYWDETLNSVCQTNDGYYCYLIDSNAFMLYYSGIAGDVNDDDISHKFFGALEPTLMQDLLDIGFFANCTHNNYIDDSLDISYTVNEDVYTAMELNVNARTFEYNSGEYTVHQITGTNLYLIYVKNWALRNVYPNNCPDHSVCSSVYSPGCIGDNSGECKSIVADACINPDVPTLPTVNCVTQNLDENILTILEEGQRSDFCFEVYDDFTINTTTLPDSADGSSGFIVGPTTMTWDEAEDWCFINHGYHLASIHSDSQNIEAAAACGDCWLGAIRTDAGGNAFTWSDNSTFSYTSWASGEPNNGNNEEDCVNQAFGGEVWSDFSCEAAFRPLCGFGWNNDMVEQPSDKDSPAQDHDAAGIIRPLTGFISAYLLMLMN